MSQKGNVPKLPSNILTVISFLVIMLAVTPIIVYTVNTNPDLYLGALTDMLVQDMESGEAFHLGTAYAGVIFWAAMSATAGLSIAYGFFWEKPLWPEKIILTLTSGFVTIGFIDGLLTLVLPWLLGGTSKTFRQPEFMYAGWALVILIGIIAHFTVDEGDDDIW